MYCPNCGKQLPEDAQFCDNCGIKMASLDLASAQNVKSGRKLPWVAIIAILVVMIAGITAVIFLGGGSNSSDDGSGSLTGSNDASDHISAAENAMSSYVEDEVEVIESGFCGSRLTWTVDENYVLTISGTGTMTDWSSYSNVPWRKYVSYITSVFIDEGVTSIGDCAFYNCWNLTSIEIPDGITSIGDCAFRSCEKLTNIDIPDSVVSVGENVFLGTSWMDSQTNGFVIVDGILVLYQGQDAEVTTPHDVKVIAAYAFFNNDSLTNVTISEGVVGIGENAFCGCDNLSGVAIPDSVTFIGLNAFNATSWLESQTDDFIIVNDILLKYQGDATVVTIPDGVTSIGVGAFNRCNLTSVDIPDSVITIEDDAFLYSHLKSVNIPSSVTHIGDWAFTDCYLSEITLSNGLISIGSNVFNGCDELKLIEIPDSVTFIEDSAFVGADGLSSITVSENNEYYMSNDGVLFDKEQTTLICCPSAKSGDFEIPDGVSRIGDWAFSWCPDLISIEIPDSVVYIGDYAFHFCKSLTNVVIPNGVTRIGYQMFYGCNSLASITIPGSVTFIGDSAFEYCSKIANVYYGGSEDDWDSIKIGSDNSNLTDATIHCNS